LVQVTGVDHEGNMQGSISMPMVEWLRKQKQLFAQVMAWDIEMLEAGTGDSMRSVEAHLVSTEYFHGLGLTPAAGRLLGDEKQEPAVGVVSYSYWQQYMGSNPGVVGTKVPIGGVRFTIIGVAPAGFDGVVVGQRPAFFIPLDAEPLLKPGSKLLGNRNSVWMPAMARIRKGLSRKRAEAGFASVYRNYVEESGPLHKEGAAHFLQLRPVLVPTPGGISFLKRQFEKPLTVLGVAVGCVLLIACVNLGSLLTARAHGRQREIAVRLSVGAGRGRLVRQMLTESFLLAGAGAALGTVLARGFDRILISMLSVGATPPVIDIRFNPLVLGFTIGVTVAATLLFGMIPALGASRDNLTGWLKDRRRLGRAALAVQVALSLALVAGAGMFLRSLRNLMTVSPGFVADGVLVADVQPGIAGFRDAAATRFYRDLRERVAALPGVEAVSYSTATPLRSCCWWDPVKIDGYVPSKGDRMESHFNQVSPGYFAAMKTPLLAGRDFRESDRADTQLVAVVNRKFADDFFKGRQAVGESFGFSGKRYAIIGVVESSHMVDFREAMPRAGYLAVGQEPKVPENLLMQVRSAGGRRPELAAEIGKIVHQFHPAIPVNAWWLSEEVDEIVVTERVLAVLSAFFAAAALLLGSIGVYGTLSYSASRRASEMGIRVALGATGAQVRWLIMRESAIVCALGVAGGLALAVWSGPWIGAFLFNLSPVDPATLAMAAGVLISTCLLSAYFPAQRAARVEVAVALRSD
jgi:predicted permease